MGRRDGIRSADLAASHSLCEWDWLNRQKLLRRVNPPRFSASIHEDVLRAPVAEPEVTRDQLFHLLFVSSEPHCAVRVIPADSCPAGVFGPAFRLLHFRNHKPVVYAENQFTSLYLESPNELSEYRQVLDRVKEFALDTDRSRTLLATVASHHEDISGRRLTPAITRAQHSRPWQWQSLQD
ncbi:DUF5753 domain-containing protein [Amycolatopsis sp. DSM 110486]|uniref:DUF5753 domain-containing protein n=1 Tax=Amycolatopsis sp. DSM 110486 TaxID=2865832 RepID=UPI001C69D92D|nr:DUF5753 domain-containing protein [Amycolatopsis sp. DSM 110486]QYN24444.1 DUF5753 domain-containing protein [Amycolatopsis sp. DSM 110486]